jgi:hypothetical protein
MEALGKRSSARREEKEGRGEKQRSSARMADLAEMRFRVGAVPHAHATRLAKYANAAIMFYAVRVF